MKPDIRGLEATLSAIVGPDHVFTDEHQLSEYETATFTTTTTIKLVVLPNSQEQLQKIMRIAHESRIPVYPISRGCNWGLGSRVPTCDDAMVIDLRRMNQILEFDEEQAYIVVEPGVTFRQASAFLSEKNSALFMSVTGGHPDSSIIGNTIERGDGLGPGGDRAHSVCALEVVLADGSLLNTGLSNFTKGSATNLTNDSLGPTLDGLFFQSNYGVITRMTVWLNPRPKIFSMAIITFSSNQQLESCLPALQKLQADRVIEGNCMAIWNIYKILASSGQHPLRDTNHGTRIPCLTPEMLAEMVAPSLSKVRWLITLAMYSPSRAHARATHALIKSRIKPHASRLVLISGRLAWVAKLLRKPIKFLRNFDIQPWLDAFYFHSAYLGNPPELSVRSLYWKMRTSIPTDINPDRDGCGVIWLCHLVPTQSAGALRAAKIVEDACFKYGFEPNIAFLNTSHRCYRMFIALIYDRTVTEEDRAALACHDELQKLMDQSGFPSFRLGLQTMPLVKPTAANYRKITAALKNLFDPAGIIAPGRYDFRESAEICQSEVNTSHGTAHQEFQ